VNSRSVSPFRLKFGFLVIAIVLSFYGARLVQLQAIDPGSYANLAYQEGLEELDLPAEPRRDPRPQRRRARLVARRPDGDRRPGADRARAPELATFLADKLGIDYFDTLRKLRKTTGDGSHYQILARRIPATKVRKVLAEAGEEGSSA
jgi:cell division protein FtsI (penicillin-binding protein 3)